MISNDCLKRKKLHLLKKLKSTLIKTKFWLQICLLKWNIMWIKYIPRYMKTVMSYLWGIFVLITLGLQILLHKLSECYFHKCQWRALNISREIYEEIGGIALRKEIEREKVVAYCRVFDCMMSKLQFFSQCGKFFCLTYYSYWNIGNKVKRVANLISRR